jgi:hypothetical protein
VKSPVPLLALVLAGCLGGRGLTETGNPNLEARMSMQARSARPDEVGVDAPDAPVSIERAVLAVKKLRLVEGDVCDAPGEVEWDVPAPDEVDLVGGTGGIDFDARTGDYCRVRLRLDDGPDGAVFVTGVRADGAPFEIRSDRTPDVDVRSRGAPFALDQAADALVLAFDVSRWLDAATLAEARPDGDGVVRIEEGRNEDVLRAFEEGLEASLELFEDLDDDDDLSDDEAVDALATSAP